jgi:hypothetical protein
MFIGEQNDEREYNFENMSCFSISIWRLSNVDISPTGFIRKEDKTKRNENLKYGKDLFGEKCSLEPKERHEKQSHRAFSCYVILKSNKSRRVAMLIGPDSYFVIKIYFFATSSACYSRHKKATFCMCG